jgi:hypothetical protein
MACPSRLAILLALLFQAACNRPPEVAPVAGVVLVHGKPAAQIVVTFHPTSTALAGWTSCAVTDDQGSFALRCPDGREGAVVGSHRVTLEDLRPYHAPRNDNIDPMVQRSSRIPSRYRLATATPLTHSVKPGGQTLTLSIGP